MAHDFVVADASRRCSARSQVRLDAAKSAKAHRRRQAVAYTAAKQSRRAGLPIIDEVGHWLSWRPQGRGVVRWEKATAALQKALAHAVEASQRSDGTGTRFGV